MSYNNKKQPIILNIAATDSAGMAGVTVDIKTQQAFGVHSMVAATATTAQNNLQVCSVNAVHEEVLKAQLKALKAFSISVVKVGLICNLEQVKIIAEFVRETQCTLILDPVFSSSSECPLFNTKDIAIYADILLPLCTLVTPNYDEATHLTCLPTVTPDDIELAADSLLLLGAKNVLIKGGHSESDMCQDYFTNNQKSFWLSSPRHNVNSVRGTGCALASSIASSLALNYEIEDALVIGKMAINQGIQNSYPVQNKRALSITHFPDNEEHLPWLNASPEVISYPQFPECNSTALGLYPIVDSSEWLQKLLPAGVSTIQLRIKDLTGALLEQEVASAVAISERFGCRLFINDHWQLAIKYGAYGVHLGQEDLDTADINAIFNAGLRLGISTHCHYEVARAIQYKPSYIACGPVFHTNTKKMPWVPHGIEGLKYWRKVLTCPLVAIAGINQDNFAQVAATGVDGIAMITAITHAEDPQAKAQLLMRLFDS
ncbi:thiamine phosphate synthase [Aliikangiella sp. IMCC44359]|uniref:thiamine phosphate synthase n=1 Tax=Aliikangiella sp. IMCC44359 TaxID=3459125 RepID=UPI00403A9EA9